MSVTRLRKLRISLAVLLPYFVLAVGSEFLHNHGRDYTVPASSAQLCYVGQPGHVALASAKLVPDRHEVCPACAWAGNSLSNLHVAVTLERSAAVSILIVSNRSPHITGGVRLPSSRAPPLS
jgi:hypothetical protein